MLMMLMKLNQSGTFHVDALTIANKKLAAELLSAKQCYGLKFPKQMSLQQSQ